MSIFRNVTFFRSDDPTRFYAVRSHRGDFDPDKHADMLQYSDCSFANNYRTNTMTVRHGPTGNTYISAPGCDKFQ